MPAYLKFYALERSPFEAESQSKVVLGTKALRDALAAIRAGLDEGAARICVSGQAGLGKTSLARALPKLLEDRTRVAVVLHPSTSWNSIRSSIAKQWRVGEGGLARSNLLSFARNARLVLVVDQAETASTDILDHLDVLLSYRSELDEPVVQSILFANLTSQPDDEPAPLIWWLDRIQTLELQFAPLPREGVASYIQKHLKRAGWTAGALFSEDAAYAIHGYTGGIPGEVDRVCERLLNEAADQNLRSIEASFVHARLDDQAEEDSSSYDTFDELAMEEAFQGAERHERHEGHEETSPGAAPSLRETLEHFASPTLAMEPESGVPDFGDEADEGMESDGLLTLDVTETLLEHVEERSEVPIASDVGAAGDLDSDSDSAGDPDAEDGEIPTLELVNEAVVADDGDDEDRDDPVDPSLVELEAYLSRPASDEELRAIRGNRFTPLLRTAALVTLAVALGGIMLLWLGGDETESASIANTDSPSMPPDTVSNPTVFANQDGLSVQPAAAPPLARLRGPVIDTAPSASAESAPQPGPAFANDPRNDFAPVPAAPGDL